ncbi:MAG: dynamin family protein, partial [Oscillospiraceae bacterium]|nr:dynamin family protein [Oscillospiraceae bacterium]
IVFADVKAGKSTLGNFISGYSFKGTPYESLYTKPVCYVYDHTDKSQNRGEEVLEQGYFEEDAIQATASIQYFTLFDGLTWVDTPGIHSLTTEYEELAKDYVKYADLIMYLTPSNGPFKQDERFEIEKLIQCDKPLLVAITKSDKRRKVEIDGKICPIIEAKPVEDITSQENFVRDEMDKLGKGIMQSQNRYISLSTKLALKAMTDNDERLFADSHIPDFLKQIGSVISEQSIELKMKRPKDELNIVVNELVSGNPERGFIGISQLIKNIDELLSDIDKRSKKLNGLGTEVLNNTKAELSNSIYTALFAEKNKGRLNDKAVVSATINSLIEEVLTKEISETIGSEIANFQQEKIEQANIVVSAEFEKKTQTIEYKVPKSGYRTRDPKGIIEHLMWLFFDKEFKEHYDTEVTRTREVEIGDNFGEFSEKVWNDVLPNLQSIVDNEIARIQNAYYGAIKSSVSLIKSDLESVQKELIAIKY